MPRTVALVLIVYVATSAIAVAADAPIDYDRDIKSVLRARCFACHGALKQESGMRLDTAASILRGGESGAAIVPGDAAGSLLIAKVSAPDEAERMPPEGKPLTPEQIAALTAWINQGARGPADEQQDADPREHWAFQPPQRGERRGEEESINPIDALLDAERKARGLKTVPPADKRLLLRRVYLDLIGLPPTREVMQEFLADPSEDAYERVVDRLLENKHYGERWGRHFMDIWRYTDWYGLDAQLRYSQKHIWHWRDWIVESLNDDKGYDRMVLEMLAADEIAPTDQDTLRASGFLARNYFLFNRTSWLDDTIEHTSKAFFGLTINCAKCHDHKYDPISQLDYYRLRAIFEPHQVRLDARPGQPDLEKDGLPRVFDAHPDAVTYLHIRGDDKNPDTSRPIEPGVPAILAFEEYKAEPVGLLPEAHNPALRPYVLEDQLKAVETEIAAARDAVAKAQEELIAAKKREEVAKAEEKEEAGDPPATVEGASAKSGDDAEVFLKDEFDQALPEVWETGPGMWEYKDGKLIQSQTGFNRAYLRTKKDHPADFQATLKFKTTGGETWKSVGLAFDCVNGREKLVYLSAVADGPKLQVAYKTGDDYVYPSKAAQSRAVELSKPYELLIRVRGPLVNVSVNSEHALAYKLPVEREKGKIDLVAFDAVVEFDSLEVRELPADVQLVPAASIPGGLPGALTITMEEAQATVAVAEKALATAELKTEVLRTAHAADVGKHKTPAPSNLAELVRAAAVAARQYEAAKAEEAVAKAEQKLAAAAENAKPQAEMELQTARAALEKAKRAIEQPGETYTSLTASLKALEGPDESAESRMKAYPATSTGRRTALARWIIDRRNPLTARVAVNHIWLRHFGQPLVESVEDFGRRAPKPPQQKLLDWLAVDLMENGWRLKPIHRLIVTSAAYRLGSSTLGAEVATQQADPTNDYYWRRRPVRMESQAVRDSLLALAGVLDPTLGGPTITPASDESVFRRSLYFNHSREGNHKFLAMFDDADIFRCYRRSESIIPQQALTLANSKLALTMSRKIAEKLSKESSAADDDQFIHAAYELILACEPNDEELVACRDAMRATRELLAKQITRSPTNARGKTWFTR